MIVNIRNGRWEVTEVTKHWWWRRTTTKTFPISGKGLSVYFAAHGIREVKAGSSVHFPREDGARISGRQADAILTKALAW